jgi:hypothetical protein
MAAHAGLIFLLNEGDGPDRSTTASAATATKPLAVRLARPGSASRPSAPQAALAEQLPPQAPTLPAAAPAPAPQAASSPPSPRIPTAVGFRYFRAHELTEQPALASGMLDGETLVVPGIAPQEAVVRFSLNDEGKVDAVAFDSHQLTEQEMQPVIEALLRMTFRPGKIGRMRVRSEVTMRVIMNDAAKS